MWRQVDLDPIRRQAAAFDQTNILVDKATNGLYSVQNRFKFELNGWFPFCGAVVSLENSAYSTASEPVIPFV